MTPTITFAFLFATACTAGAGKLPLPTGEVILTVSGRIENTNVGDTAQFDREMLEAMGLVDVTTTTPWRKGELTFSGVPFQVLLREVGAWGETITTVALDSYQSEIPVSDTLNPEVILALKLNGEDMVVRDKGPIFIIYPYDSWVGYQSQTYYSRSTWQLTRIFID